MRSKRFLYKNNPGLKNTVFWSLLALCIVFWSSCRKDFEYRPNTGKLEFSKDTVFLDTVFTNIGSSTYTLKVYNRSNDDIQIPTVTLAGGESSSYRLNVDGNAGKTFNNVPIMAKDSIFVFVETTFDISPLNENSFLYTDAIVFESANGSQQVPLVTLVKDAVFLFPSTLADGSKETLLLGLDEMGNEVRIEGFVLTDEQLNFTNEKPYVIYGYAAVADGKTLSMQAGTRVHFHEDSGILVGTGGSLSAVGSLSEDSELLENEVVLQGDRLEPLFTDVPGQWGTVWMAPGSVNNELRYTTIKNATVGLLVEGNPESSPPTLTLHNVQIHNSSSVNLWARESSVTATNTVLGSAGNASLVCSLGGSYSFIHSTIANYWSQSFREGAALQLTNFENAPGSTLRGNLVQAAFRNCIVDGNTGIELFLSSDEVGLFNYSFEDCMIKFRDPNNQFSDNPLYDFNDPTHYTAIYLNEEAAFLDPADHEFGLMEGSAAIGKGALETAILVPLDLLGRDRTATPDLGAFQFVPDP